jgi:O-antigen/teichoic acid export membrane protein
LRITELLAYVTVPASIGIALTAGYLVPVFLGPRWAGVVGPLRLLGILVAFRSVSTVVPKVLTAVRDTKFVMWVTVASAMVMPLGFLAASHWGADGIAMAWIIMFPPLMLPLYYRTFRRIETNAWEYLSAVMPAITASAIMTIAILLLRRNLPLDWPLSARLFILVACGALCYGLSLFVLYRRRMIRLLQAFRRVRNEQITPVEVESDSQSAMVATRPQSYPPGGLQTSSDVPEEPPQNVTFS